MRQLTLDGIPVIFDKRYSSGTYFTDQNGFLILVPDVKKKGGFMKKPVKKAVKKTILKKKKK